jgi:hypothetical protein
MKYCVIAMLIACGGFASDSCSGACGFGCFGKPPTISGEIEAADVAVIACLVAVPTPLGSGDEESYLPRAAFEAIELLKGRVPSGRRIAATIPPSAKLGDQFFLTGTSSETGWVWHASLLITPSIRAYLRALCRLPANHRERLLLFVNHLEAEEPLLARDACDELGQAPYAALQAIGDQMDHDQLIRDVQDLQLPASKRRLFFHMLSVCGNRDDLALLEGFARSGDQQQMRALDALLFCHLTLGGNDAIDLVDELFLRPREADYAHTFSAILAVRFYYEHHAALPKSRMVQSLRIMLDRPELADLVIPDLVRLGDWDSMDKVMNLFRTAKRDSAWLLEPAVMYLLACPVARAQQLLEECRQIDPKITARARARVARGGIPE